MNTTKYYYHPSEAERAAWGMTSADPRTVQVTADGVYVYHGTESQERVCGWVTASIIIDKLKAGAQ